MFTAYYPACNKNLRDFDIKVIKIIIDICYMAKSIHYKIKYGNLVDFDRKPDTIRLNVVLNFRCIQDVSR